MRPLKDRGCPNREIEFTGEATIKTNPFARANILSLAARRAGRTVGPQPGFKVFSGGLYIGKLLEELESAYCASAH